MNHRLRLQAAFRLLVCLSLWLLSAGWAPAPAGAAPQSAGAIDAAPAQPDAIQTLTFAAVAAGSYHTCGLTADGGVKCWGTNENGQLGDGTTTSHSTPADVVGLTSGVTAISAGSDHTCALMAGGGVKCWGYNGYGQLGDGTTARRSAPVDVVGLASAATAIDAGSGHTCARLVDGKAACWGANQYGQLGDGSTTPSSTPRTVAGLSDVTAITAGGWHTCGLTASGGAQCWGRNRYGQLGDATNDQRTAPVGVAGLANGVTAITAGGYHTCALVEGGVKCWGYNGDGQLGDGTTANRNAPVHVTALAGGVTAIVAGGYHTCVLAAGGGASCWGYNAYGQLGDGTIAQRRLPTGVYGLASGVTAMTGSSYHTCAVLSGGGAKCWGYNSNGQLGDGTATQRAVPTDVAGLTSGVTAIAAGAAHTCGLLSGGAVKCWGSNGSGQVGDGTNWARGAPADVSGLPSGVAAIAAGGSHNCALVPASGGSNGLLSGGGVKCWGANHSGQLGDGTTIDQWAPTDVPGLTSGVTAIAAGGSHTCAALAGGGVQCWGNNAHGQLGDGTTEERTSPVAVTGLTGVVTAIAAGWGHTCVLLSGGGAQCWGTNTSGQLGDGTTESRSGPVDVLSLSGATAIVAGNYHTCALAPATPSGNGPAPAAAAGSGLTTSGGMSCWGANERGQLGDGTWQSKSAPVAVIGIAENVTGIAAGGFHTCATTSSGSARCWGYNDYGQLGDGTIANRNTPSDVAGLASGGSGIAAGSDHTCVLVGAGRPKCWGRDEYGQLGAGRTLHQTTPVDVLAPAPALLTINYPNGRPGSLFTITGWNFPPGATATVAVNGQAIAPTLPVNPTGSFLFFLDTAGADAGGYSVAVSANPSAATSFRLGGGAPLRLQEGGGQVLVVPGGHALGVFAYLPLVSR